MSNYEKGARRERELMKLLDEKGFALMRSPGSGHGGKKSNGEEREQPDVLAGNGEKCFAFESKASGDDVIYIDEEEIEDLRYFSKMFGAEPRVAVRFDYEDFYFFHPLELYRTDGGNYRIKKEKIEKENLYIGETLSELVC